MAPKYHFPLSDQQDYKARVNFFAYTDYTTTLSDLELGTYNAVKDAAKSNEGFLENVFNQASEIASNATDFVGSLYESFTADNYRTYTTNTPVVQESRGTVSLFLPNAIQIADGVEYTTATLNRTGGALAGALRSGGSLGDAARSVANQLGNDLESITDLIAGQGGAEIAALKVLRANGSFAGAVETEAGVALNPNRRSALGGINIRRFNFQFKLIPNSYEESQEIKKIIRFFRTEMYPEAVGVISEQANVSAALRYPSKFKITMTYDGKKIATGILPCFLENFTATYNPTGMSFHKGGDFQEIDILMSFLEERPLTRKDVIED